MNIRRTFVAVLIGIATVVFSNATKAQSTSAQSRNETTSHSSIVILFENDVHCAIDGYPVLAGWRDAIADTAWAAIVSCGDFLQGGSAGILSRGKYIVDIMGTMCYDAVTLGNHEFDYYTPYMTELLAKLNAPVVCCNLFDMDGHRLLAPYTIRSYGKRKVAYIGVLAPKTMTDEAYAFYDTQRKQLYDLPAQRTYELVQQSVDAARAEGADYVVVLSHLGSSDAGDGITSKGLIAATSGIDAVLDGHEHAVFDTIALNANGDTVLFAQTGAYFANIGRLTITADGTMDITLTPTSQVPYRSAIVGQVVDVVKARLDEKTSKVVFHSDVPLHVENGPYEYLIRKIETNAGDLVADAIRYVGKAQIGMINGGAIRTDVAAGDVTYNNMVNMLPYEDYVWTISATGDEISDVIKAFTASLPDEDGNFPQVAGLRYTIHQTSHTVSNIEVEQEDGSYAPIEPTRRYSVAVLHYCSTGGGFGNKLMQCPVIGTTDVLYRDALVQYVNEKLGGKVSGIYTEPQGRIVIEVRSKN